MSNEPKLADGADKSTLATTLTVEAHKPYYRHPTSQFTRSVYGLFFEPQDAVGLAAFRILWGMMIVYEMFLFSRNGFEKMAITYYSSAYRMPFPYTEWLTQPSRANMEIIICFAFFAALCVMCGFAYRLAAITFFVLFSYMFVLEAAYYLNHFYLLIIISFAMIFVSANARMSVDSVLFPSRFFRSRVPAWNYFIFKSAVFVVYVWAVLVKLNVDWLRGEPLRHWILSSMANKFPTVKYFMTRWYTPYIMSYGGIVVDILQPILLVQSGWSHTMGLIITVVFHASNKIFMNIGLFPFMCIILSSLFSSAGWPRRFTLNDNVNLDDQYEQALMVRRKDGFFSAAVWNGKIGFRRWCVVFLICAWLLFLVLSPARFVLRTTRDQQAWNEVNHEFSWRMKLRSKSCDGFFYSDFGNGTLLINPFMNNFITFRQYSKTISDPWYIRYFANALADLLQREHPSHIRPRIYTDVTCSMNYRYPMPFVLPDVDLTSDAVAGPVEKWVIPIPGLSPQHGEQYPWNWDWRGILNGTVDMQAIHEKWIGIQP